MNIRKRYPKLKNQTHIEPKRHTHATAAGLEDAMAVAWDIIQEQARVLSYAQSRAQRVIEILQSVRSGPHSYKEQPSGMRMTIRKR